MEPSNLSLASLPSDPLSCITSYVSGFDVINLWFCGNKALNWKLGKAGGVKVFILEPIQSKIPFWPSLLRELGDLREISIQSGVEHEYPIPVVPNFMEVTPKLQKLDFYFPLDMDFTLSALLLNPGHFQNLTSLACTFAGTSGRHNMLEGVKLPNLTNLTLLSLLSSLPKPGASIRLATLPTSLVNLKLTVFEFTIDKDAEFPPNLTNFSLDCSKSQPFYGKLPSTMKKLCYSNSSGLRQDEPPRWTALPQTLTKFKTCCYSVSLAQIRTLPRGLLHLHLMGLGEFHSWPFSDFIEALPPNLIFCPNIGCSEISKEMAQVLPRQWRGDLGCIIDPEAAHLLPSGIDTISMYLSEASLLDSIQGFPSSLTKLSITYLDERVSELLPRNLKILCVDSADFTPEIIKLLPPKLTELTTIVGSPFRTCESWSLISRDVVLMDCTPSHNTADFEISILVDDPESSSWLPPRLEFLTLGRLNIQCDGWFAQLPSTLTSMQLMINAIPLDSLLSLNIPSLISLDLIATGSRPDASVHTWEGRLDLPNLLRTLPHHLEIFTFRSRPKQPWKYVEEDLKHLPPRMSSLTLPGSTVEISAKILPFLPNALFSIGGQFSPNLPWCLEHKIKVREHQIMQRKQKVIAAAPPQTGVPTDAIDRYLANL